jgi:hypothetical protein
MKVFMDMADQYGDVRIVAIGAVDTARQVVEYDAEMRNRVAEIHVPLMSDDEIREIMSKGELCLDFLIDPSVKEGIVRYSNGLAAVCHHLCLNLCSAAGIRATCPTPVQAGRTELTQALEQYFEECSDTLKAAFDRALSMRRRAKFDNCRMILQALTQFDQPGATHNQILKAVREREPEYPAGNCTYYLSELQAPQRGSLLRFDSISGRYSFADPLFRAFAIVLFEKEVGVHLTVAPGHPPTSTEILAVLRKVFESWSNLGTVQAQLGKGSATPPSTPPSAGDSSSSRPSCTS